MRDIPEHERSLAERYRLASVSYNKAAAQARDYRENKGVVFSRMVMAAIDQDPKLAVNKAELMIKSSDAWRSFLDKLIEASNLAGELKTEVRAIEIEAEMIKMANIQAARERRYG